MTPQMNAQKHYSGGNNIRLLKINKPQFKNTEILKVNVKNT